MYPGSCWVNGLLGYWGAWRVGPPTRTQKPSNPVTLTKSQARPLRSLHKHTITSRPWVTGGLARRPPDAHPENQQTSNPHEIPGPPLAFATQALQPHDCSPAPTDLRIRPQRGPQAAARVRHHRAPPLCLLHDREVATVVRNCGGDVDLLK